MYVTAGTNTINERKGRLIFSRRCPKCHLIQKTLKKESNKTIICKNCGARIPAKIIRR